MARFGLFAEVKWQNKAESEIGLQARCSCDRHFDYSHWQMFIILK